MKRKGRGMVITDLRETYHEEGDYEFKIILDKRKFDDGHGAEIMLLDPESSVVDLETRTWGRKIMCTFSLSEKTPEGVGLVEVKCRNSKGRLVRESFRFWVVM